MNVLFLDVDGVLNSEAWFWRQSPLPLPALDPAAVARLDRIVRATGCAVVVSSSWRGEPRLPGWLRDHGYGGALLDRTPYLPRDACRGDEIAAWLAAHPEVGRFVILDDDDDLGALGDRLVRCDHRHGLTDALADEVIARLR